MPKSTTKLARLKYAPLSKEQVAMLKADCNNLRATAERKNVTLSKWEEWDETTAANTDFDLGCWLYYYKDRIYDPCDQDARVDCARRIFERGYNYLHYEFFTSFDFGERQFDTIFEMGDAREVIARLRVLAQKNPNGPIANAFQENKWPIFENSTQSLLPALTE